MLDSKVLRIGFPKFVRGVIKFNDGFRPSDYVTNIVKFTVMKKL